MSRSRTLGLLIALGLLLVACSAQADPVRPSDRPTGHAPATATPFAIERATALDAVRSLRPRGFTRVLTCASRRREACQAPGTGRSRWLVGTQSNGAGLARGNGLGEWVRVMVTAWPTTTSAAAYAGRLTAKLQRYRGEYDIVLRKTSAVRYVPADRGRGEVHRVSMSGWRGSVLRRVFHYVFYDLSPSAPVPGGHAVLSQGRYVVDVEWVARNQATDRRLSRLPRQLLRALR